MDSPAACKVNGPVMFVQKPFLVPDPMGRKRVYKRIEEGEHNITHKVGPFSYRARYNSCCCCGETGLKEKVGENVSQTVRVFRVQKEIALAEKSMK